MIKITLKDGSVREVAKGSSILDVAKSISEGLARNAQCGKVNGEVKDLRTILNEDCALEICTFDSQEGKDAVRHSVSHVLAAAVKRLFPEAKIAIGPSIENGFYYDFDTEKAQYENLGCRILEVPQKDGHIDLQVLMRLLGEENVDGILLEGGGTLNWSALRAEIVDAVQTYIAPKIFGGTAQSPVEGAGVALPDEGIRLENTRCISCGEDYRIESDVVYTCLQEA